jgi:hypothetical protein
MKKCNTCGENNFWVNEGMTWKASLDEDGVLQCFKPNSMIESIICTECGKEFTEEEFNEVNFN